MRVATSHAVRQPHVVRLLGWLFVQLTLDVRGWRQVRRTRIVCMETWRFAERTDLFGLGGARGAPFC